MERAACFCYAVCHGQEDSAASFFARARLNTRVGELGGRWPLYMDAVYEGTIAESSLGQFSFFYTNTPSWREKAPSPFKDCLDPAQRACSSARCDLHWPLPFTSDAAAVDFEVVNEPFQAEEFVITHKRAFDLHFYGVHVYPKQGSVGWRAPFAHKQQWLEIMRHDNAFSYFALAGDVRARHPHLEGWSSVGCWARPVTGSGIWANVGTTRTFDVRDTDQNSSLVRREMAFAIREGVDSLQFAFGDKEQPLVVFVTKQCRGPGKHYLAEHPDFEEDSNASAYQLSDPVHNWEWGSKYSDQPAREFVGSPGGIGACFPRDVPLRAGLFDRSCRCNDSWLVLNCQAAERPVR